MKKIFPIVLLLVICGAAWYFMSSPQPSPAGAPAGQKETPGGGQAQGTAADSTEGVSSPGAAGDAQPGGVAKEDEDFEEDIRPATELYKSADEAFEAVRKGSADYDDLVLEQFAELGEDCTWCPQFYDQVKQAMLSAEASEDQKSYYAEVLAISGKPENLATLIDAIKEAGSEDAADVYAEALEVAMGDNKTVSYLGEQLDTDNELLKESLIAAITNHGSPLAIDLLYKETVKHKDPDGYYSLGIGLGEVIPDEESLPYLTELAAKRDGYSHLAVKALLNYGTDGLRIVMDSLGTSNDPDFDRRMLQDAIDHVNYEEETETYVKNVLQTSKNPVVQEFAKQILSEFELEDEDEDEQ